MREASALARVTTLRRLRARPLAWLTLLSAVLLPACYDWHVPELGPAPYIARERPEIVRVTLGGGTKLDVEGPEVIRGSIVGVLGPQGRGRMMIDSTVVLPLDEVSTVEVRELNRVRTAVAVVAVVGGLIAAFTSVSLRTENVP